MDTRVKGGEPNIRKALQTSVTLKGLGTKETMEIKERVQKLRDILKTTKLDQKHNYVIKVDLLYLKYRENLTGCRYPYKDSKSKSEISIRAKYLTYFSRIRVFGKSKSNSHSL